LKTRKTLPTINDAKALDELGGSGAGGGDMPDLQSLHLTVMDHNLGTLVPSMLAFIQHGDVRALMRRHPHLGDLLWRDTLIEAAVFRQWILGLGRRSAHERIAHRRTADAQPRALPRQE